ncbi:ABC transporter permease [Conexibacter sp. CPCC 206217]|uniref:ABC transporter permease n=1 Tax=Conexibacter sp. CPCC 206217 TaxID=3064574 RepID=UPI0027284E80|nr:ABC transporter permease [Conexibacter sp. CPCC 206217]MDO8208813.1 ABC transporter permease [Conexibacter sp. CPCC 206217]
MRTRAIGWIPVILLLVLWQVSVKRGWIDTPELPALSDVLSAWRSQLSDGTLTTAIGETLRVMGWGYLAGGAAGFVIGLLMGRFLLVFNLLEPLTELIRPIPLTAIVPLLVLFLGIGDRLKIVAVAIAVFFPIMLNTAAGVRGVSTVARDTGRTFRLSSWREFVEITIPGASGAIFVGLRLAIAIALIITVFSEMTSGNTGLGYFVLLSQQQLDVVNLYVGVLTLAVIGYALNLALTLIERLVRRWAYL